MARQDNSQRSVADKCAYYEKRINNPKLSDGQRRWAQLRLNQLCGNSTRPTRKPAAASPGGKYTDAQKQSYNAGVAYGLAKTGRQMRIKPENQSSFQAGVKAGRSGKYAK